MITPVFKPSGMTSHDVVAKIKRAMAVPEKIGHTGTLDPMCTGVLPILTGKYTRLSDLLPSDKAYRCCIFLGRTTDTQDVTGKTVTESGKTVSEDEFIAALSRFEGEQEQIPPMYSAIKKGGVPLYKLARKGIETERLARKVNIYSIKYERQDADNEFVFTVKCSSGTYIRTICEDLGNYLDCGGCMKSLERIEANSFFLSQCIPLEQAVKAAANGELDKYSFSCEESFSYLDRITVPDDGFRYYINGGSISFGRLDNSVEFGKLYRSYSPDGTFAGLAKAYEDGVKSEWTELV